jgi:hypothetical protein
MLWKYDTEPLRTGLRAGCYCWPAETSGRVNCTDEDGNPAVEFDHMAAVSFMQTCMASKFHYPDDGGPLLPDTPDDFFGQPALPPMGPILSIP